VTAAGDYRPAHLLGGCGLLKRGLEPLDDRRREGLQGLPGYDCYPATLSRVWTAIRFVHVLSAIAWLGAQMTLFALFPVLRRRLEGDQFRVVARAAGMRLGIVAAVTLPALLASGIALAAHEVPHAQRAWVVAKLVIWALVLAAFAGHARTASRQRRPWLSELMLGLSLAAAFIGTRLTEM
jgi:uncharacterized membrane protein